MNKSSSGIVALFLVGGYYVYRNRHRILSFFESKGVNVPRNVDELKDIARSGVSKLRGEPNEGIEQKVS
jgi:hypothetical protein